MRRTHANKVVLLALVLTTAVGATDAALEDAWDHFVLFLVAGVLALILTVAFWLGRPALPVRADLVRWATRRSQLTGEPVEDVTDRALAGYRDLLEPAPGPGAGSMVAGPSTPPAADDR